MINFQEVKIKKAIIHKVGNRLKDHDLELSNSVIELNENSESLLINHLLRGFNKPELFEFKHEVELEMNEVYKRCKLIFNDDDESVFTLYSQHLANHMYDSINSAKVNDCEFAVVYFEDVIINDETLEAIGIFKLETSGYFVPSLFEEIEFKIGTALGKIEFGALVLNTREERGYLVNLIKPKTSFFTEWLDLNPFRNSYLETQTLIESLDKFFTLKLFDVEIFERVTKLRHCLNWLKANDEFDLREMFNDIFEGDYDAYVDFFNESNNFDNFTINDSAVKKHGKLLLKKYLIDEKIIIDATKSNAIISKDSDAKGNYVKIYYKDLVQK